MKVLTKEQVLLLHQIIIKYTGGTEGLRDENLLDSALFAPFAEFGGIIPYKTLQSKAARLCFGLVKNHPFIDGNKRIGILVMMSFLEANGIILECNDNELVKLGVELADGLIGENEVLEFIIEHS